MLCLTETWLKPDEYILLNESAPQDYCYKNEPRPKGKGGGVATIYSNTLSISQKTGFKYNLFEVMVLRITLSREKYCKIYRQEFNSTSHQKGGQLKNQQPSKSPSSASAQKRAFSSCCGTKGMCGNASQRHSFISWLSKHPQRNIWILMCALFLICLWKVNY